MLSSALTRTTFIRDGKIKVYAFHLGSLTGNYGGGSSGSSGGCTGPFCASGNGMGMGGGMGGGLGSGSGAGGSGMRKQIILDLKLFVFSPSFLLPF